MKIQYETVVPEHIDELVRIRIAAMQDSLEKIGRFDPERARDRLVGGFIAEHTRFITLGAIRVGFITVTPQPNQLLIDHLYIEPDYQGKSIGSIVLQEIIAIADAQGLSLRVTALRGSGANRFYLKHGFHCRDESQWDIHYERSSKIH